MYHKTSEIFEFNKMLFVYLSASFALCLWIWKIILNRKIIIQKNALNIPILLFFASLVLSTLFSIDLHTSIFGYYGRFNGSLLSFFAYLILYFAFISNIGKTDAIKFLKISVLTSLLVILWALPGRFGHDLSCLLFTGEFTNACWSAQFRPAERLFSTLGQPNWLGAYLVINFFIGIYFFLKEWASPREATIKSWAMRVYLLLTFTAILFTRSRSSLLAFAISLTLMGVFLYFNKKNLLKKFAILVFLFIISIFIFKTGISRIDQFPTFPTSKSLPAGPPAGRSDRQVKIESGGTESFDIRKIVWRGGILLGLKYPIFGTGVETFAQSYFFVRPVEHNNTTEWDFIYNKAHNEFINFFATTGGAGLISYLLIIVLACRLFFKKSFDKKSPFAQRLLFFCLFCAYISIHVTNFFGFSTVTTNIYFFMIPALAIVFDKKAPVKKVAPKISNRIKYLLSGPILIFIVSAFFLIRYFLADINYAKGQEYTAIGDYETARVYYQKALFFKNEHVYHDRLSQSLASLAFIKSYEKSAPAKTAEIEKMLNLSNYYNSLSLKSAPKNVFYWKTRIKNFYLIYQILPTQESFREAESAIKSAHILAPTDPKIYYTKALLYISRMENSKGPLQKERIEWQNKAINAAKQALRLKPDYIEAKEALISLGIK